MTKWHEVARSNQTVSHERSGQIWELYSEYNDRCHLPLCSTTPVCGLIRPSLSRSDGNRRHKQARSGTITANTLGTRHCSATSSTSQHFLSQHLVAAPYRSSGDHEQLPNQTGRPSPPTAAEAENSRGAGATGLAVHPGIARSRSHAERHLDVAGRGRYRSLLRPAVRVRASVTAAGRANWSYQAPREAKCSARHKSDRPTR